MKKKLNNNPRGLTYAELADKLGGAVKDGDFETVGKLVDIVRYRADGSRREEIARCDKGEICPRCCSEDMQYPALSRIDNKTKVCPQCGEIEAFEFSRGPRGSPFENGGSALAVMALMQYRTKREVEQMREAKK